MTDVGDGIVFAENTTHSRSNYIPDIELTKFSFGKLSMRAQTFIYELRKIRF